MTTLAQSSPSAHPTVPPSPDPTSVYRYYDGHGLLIYVGITRQGMGRNLQHNGNAEWWKYVSRQDVEHFPSRAVAMAREKELIRQFRPPFNKQHNIDHGALRESYLRFAVQFQQAEGAFGAYKASGSRLECLIEQLHGKDVLLRTTLDDTLLASHLRFREALPPMYAWVDQRTRHRVGAVQRIEHAGRFTYLHCRVSGKRTLPERIASARVRIKWQQLEKPHFPYIKYVDLFAEGVAAS